MIIKILAELIIVLEVLYKIVIDRIGISTSEKVKLIVHFKNLRDFVDQYARENGPPNQ